MVAEHAPRTFGAARRRSPAAHELKIKIRYDDTAAPACSDSSRSARQGREHIAVGFCCGGIERGSDADCAVSSPVHEDGLQLKRNRYGGMTAVLEQQRKSHSVCNASVQGRVGLLLVSFVEDVAKTRRLIMLVSYDTCLLYYCQMTSFSEPSKYIEFATGCATE